MRFHQVVFVLYGYPRTKDGTSSYRGTPQFFNNELYYHTVEVGGSSPSAPTPICRQNSLQHKHNLLIWGLCFLSNFKGSAGVAKSVAKWTQLFHNRDREFDLLCIHTICRQN